VLVLTDIDGTTVGTVVPALVEEAARRGHEVVAVATREQSGFRLRRCAIVPVGRRSGSLRSGGTGPLAVAGSPWLERRGVPFVRYDDRPDSERFVGWVLTTSARICCSRATA
jgi:hypothetical protein